MKKLLLVLLVSTVALGATTMHLVRQLREERASAQELRARVAELERAQPRAHPFTAPAPLAPIEPPPAPPEPVAKSPRASASQPRESRQALNVFGSAAPVQGPGREEAIRMMRENVERERALLRDPEYREAMRAQHKAMLPNMYPDLEQELELSAEQADGLMNLLAEHQLQQMEKRDTNMFEGPPSQAKMQELQRKAQADHEARESEIRQLLGEQKWRAWQDYQSTMGVRHQVRELRNTLASKGAPLGDHQVKPLQRALAEAQRQQVQEWSRRAPAPALVAGGTSASPVAPVEAFEAHLQQQREHNERTRNALASILTYEQLEAFEEQQNAQLRLQEAHLRIMRARAEAQSRGEAPPAAEANAFFVGPGVYAAPMVTVEPQQGQ